MVHQLEQEQVIPASLEEVWAFFSTPKNLDTLTPPDMAFEIVRGGGQPMYQGQMIEYRVGALPGLKTRWLTEITHVEAQTFFVDEQRLGPYRIWHHEHHFCPVDGGVQMVDRITYVLPFGVLGDAVHACWVRRRLEAIFAFRYDKVEALFGKRAFSAAGHG